MYSNYILNYINRYMKNYIPMIKTVKTLYKFKSILTLGPQDKEKAVSGFVFMLLWVIQIPEVTMHLNLIE